MTCAFSAGFSHVIARRRTSVEAIPGLSEEVASGKEHTCPGGLCKGKRPRNDNFLSILEIFFRMVCYDALNQNSEGVKLL